MAQRAKEVGTHVKSQSVDEHGESEALREEQHVMIDGDAQVPHHDTHKEYKSHAQRDSSQVYLAQGHAGRADNGEHHHGLQRGMDAHEFL